MNTHVSGRAAILGSAVLTTLLLSSCGAPALTMDEAKVKISKDVIASLENSWKDHRSTMPASNVAEESGCYIEASGEEMTGNALCGPVRYLGDDTTGWDEIAVAVTGSEPAVDTHGTFTTGPVSSDTDLIRPDGREAARDATVPEPAAPNTAKALEVFSTDEVLASSAEPVEVKLPQGELTVDASAVRERAGGAADRTAAPDGYRVASVSFTAEDLDDVPRAGSAELSFVVDGTSYPVEDLREGGTVSIAVPEKSEVSFGVTFDKVEQTVSIPDLKLETGDASSLYAPPWEGLVVEEKIIDGTVWGNMYANRVAHHRSEMFDLGWAGKDQVWVGGSAVFGGTEDGEALRKEDGMKVVSAVMTTEDGTQLEAVGTSLFYSVRNMWQIDGVYRAPVDVGNVIWNVTAEDNLGNVYKSGPLLLESEED